jgi:hypothetical protein
MARALVCGWSGSWLRPLLASLFASGLALVGLAGCGTEAGSEAETETDTGPEPGTVTFVVEADPEPICAGSGGSITLMARKVDCWDPQLPCTLPNPPQWIEGDTINCSSVVAGELTRFEIDIVQTGRWQARLQASELACFGLAGEARTDVSRADIEAGIELSLSPAATGVCGEP